MTLQSPILVSLVVSGLFSVASGIWRKRAAASYNVFRRIGAIYSVGLGTILLALTAVSTVQPGIFHTNPSLGIGQRLAVAAIFAFVLAIGVDGLRSPTYRPDLGDTMRGRKSKEAWYQELARRNSRNWWTGEPLAASAHHGARPV
ncbi:MAG TPA: hypothetical protein VE110_10345 [Gemmatimonadaceae bacterium]|nr:hypothetical protein [Gemmatimonadaceae bacterium]